MSLSFHRNLYDLLNIEPRYSAESLALLEAIEAQHNITLPPALREWYCIDNYEAVSDMIMCPHDLIRLAELQLPNIPEPPITAQPIMLPVVYENQGVWELAIPVANEDDPAVFLRYQDEPTIWRRHADTLSDCLFAFAWDYVILEQGRGVYDVLHDSDLQNWWGQSATKGPTTFGVSAYFISACFLRYQDTNGYVTLMKNE